MMRIPIAIGHFFAGQGALSVVYLLYMSESATQPCGLALKSGHAALHIAHLEQLNFALRALPGRI